VNFLNKINKVKKEPLKEIIFLNEIKASTLKIMINLWLKGF